MEVRTIADWTIRRRLQAIPGIAEVLNMGGGVKQATDPARPMADAGQRRHFGGTRNCRAQRGSNTTGGFIDSGPQEIMVRNLAMTVRAGGPRPHHHQACQRPPRRHLDVATVAWGTEPMRGDGHRQRQPGVIMSVTKAPGFDTIALTEKIEAAIAELKPPCPRRRSHRAVPAARLHRPCHRQPQESHP